MLDNVENQMISYFCNKIAGDDIMPQGRVVLTAG